MTSPEESLEVSLVALARTCFVRCVEEPKKFLFKDDERCRICMALARLLRDLKALQRYCVSVRESLDMEACTRKVSPTSSSLESYYDTVVMHGLCMLTDEQVLVLLFDDSILERIAQAIQHARGVHASWKAA